MKKFIYSTLIFTIAILAGCSDDDSTSSNNPSGNTTTNADFKGQYTGNFSYLIKEKATSDEVDWDTANVVLNISGTAPNFTISYDGDPAENFNIVSSGNTFTGSDGESNYAGKLDGDLLTFNETGEDSEYSWDGNYTGTRPATGGGNGGGTGNNTLSVSGETVGSFWTSNCSVDFNASFAADGDNEWHVTIYSLENCDHSNNGTGTYTIVDKDAGLDNGECAIYVKKEDDEGLDLLNLDSRANSGSMRVTFVNGKKRVSVSNLTLHDSVNVISKVVNFTITEE